MARAAADKLLAEKAITTDIARIDRAYRLSLARPPTDRERATSLDFIEGSVSGNSTADERRDIWPASSRRSGARPSSGF